LRYIALSYCWGDASIRQTVYVFEKDAELSLASLQVTSNLYACLVAVRDPVHVCTLWIDAVCIDQSSIAERNSQVALMRHIYKSAAEVRVWLGPADCRARSSQTIAFARLLARLDPHIHDAFRPGRGRVTPYPGHSAWIDLLLLFQSPWFSRAWIVQEVLYARRIVAQCGKECLMWDELWRARQYLLRTGFIGMPDLEQRQISSMIFSCASRLAVVYPMPPDPLFILLDCKMQLATDPRDKVFAFYGLLPGFLDGMGLRPNYNRTVTDVYTILTKEWLERFNNLDILTAIAGGDGHGDTESLPSWVVDWSRDTVVIPLLHTKRFFIKLPATRARFPDSALNPVSACPATLLTK
jgi:Heterokaryon incompatibility protein (HET)